MPISIRTRLTATFTLALIGVLLIANLALSGFSRRLATLRADHVLREASKTASRSVLEALERYASTITSRGLYQDKPPGPELPVRAAVEHTRQELSEDHVDILVIDNLTGRIIRSNLPEPGLPWPAASSNGWRIKTAQLPAGVSSVQVGSYTIITGIPWYRIAAGLHTQDLQVGELCTFFVLLFGIATWIVVGYTLRPIARLAEQARGFQDGPSAVSERIQLTAPSPDAEVVGLVGTLNLLLDSIAESADVKARFYTSASHELRTPLHVLSGKVELTLSRSRSAEEYESAMVEIQQQTERLTMIIESLLLLNRLDRGTREAPMAAVALEPICEQQLNLCAPLLATRGLTVTTNLIRRPDSRETMINAPEMHVEIMLRNLIENAAKYAKLGSEIAIRLAYGDDANTVSFAIYNDAETIDDAEFRRLCEPFYRPDGSRGARTGGNGLGLSICQALANANSWKLELAQEHGGITATVAFLETGHC